MAGHVPRGVAREKEGRTQHVFRFAESLQGRVGFAPSLHRGIGPQLLSEIGQDEAGGDRVHADVVLAPLHAHPARHHSQPRFAHRIRQDALQWCERVERVDVDDRPPVPLRDHLPTDGLRDEERSLEIDVQNVVVLGLGVRFDSLANVDSRHVE